MTLSFTCEKRVNRKQFKHKKIHRKSVFICAPYAGNIKYNVANAKNIARMLWEFGYMPVCPHISADFLDETTERDKALDYCLNLLDMCDFIYVDLTGPITAGMRGEIAYAKSKGLKNLEVK